MLQARVLLGFSPLSLWSAVSEGEPPIGELASSLSLHVAGKLRGSALGRRKTFASPLSSFGGPRKL